MQSKKHSFIEVLSNTAIGFVISLIATFIVFPYYEVETSSKQKTQITLAFTVISIIRSYVIRRYFNGKIVRLNTTKMPFKLHCFDCEIDMPVKKDEKGLYCSNCGLRH